MIDPKWEKLLLISQNFLQEAFSSGGDVPGIVPV